MKRKALIWFLWIFACISVLLLSIAIAKTFVSQPEKELNINGLTLPETEKTEIEVIAPIIKEDIPLTMANVSKVVLTNTDVEDNASSKRASLIKFFYIPVNAEAVINITNNSVEFKYSVIGFSDDLIYDYTGSGWVEPGATLTYTLDSDTKYITISVARIDECDLDVESIDLSAFMITYCDSEKNLLDTLLSAAEIYNKAGLNGYDFDRLTALSQKSTVAHACGTDISAEQLTMAALKNAVETDGFKTVELDVRETADNVLVCYHDETLAGTRTSVRYSTFERLKSEKADIASLEEILDYCGTNNIGVVLDVKDVYSTSAVSSMFYLLEKNDLKDKFFFAGRPQFLSDNMPEEYKNVSYSVYSGWDASYNGQSNIRCSTRCGWRIELNKISDLLKSGHRAFELFDTDKSVSGTELFENDLAVFMYLCSAFDASYNLTLYNNVSVPVLSEKEIIRNMPKDFWDSLGVIYYE